MDEVVEYDEGTAMKVAFVEHTMRRVFRRMVEGLERHVNTGDLIGKDGVIVAVAG